MPVPTSEILFEKFQIIEVLKKDEHAAVFLANHIYLSKKIILKVLNTLKIPDSSLVERFKREAKILARLDHPNIIKVLDFGMSKEYFYISFEYIEGESLRNTFKNKSLSAEQKEHLMIQFLRGLDFAHKNQIIHRDIKPENIFVDKNLNVKLGDFGLALSAEDNFVTNPYSIVGTPSYMSPEQVRGAKLTQQSDLFSAGVVLFELFTGRNPFLKDNVNLTLNEINSFDENSIEEKLKNVSDRIGKILIKLLKKTPKLRYSSAEEILKEMNAEVEYPTIVIKNFLPAGNRIKIILLLGSLFILILLGIIFLPRNEINRQNATPINPVQNGGAANSVSGKPGSIPPNNNVLNNNLTELKKGTEANPAPGDIQAPPVRQTQKGNTEPSQKPLEYGGLLLDSRPWARVYIDGQEMGQTPYKSPVTLLEGDHTIKFVADDYPPQTEIVTIKHDQVANLKFLFDSKMGVIRIAVLPWGAVYINEELKAKEVTAPKLISVLPDPNWTHIQIKNPGFKDVDTMVRIRMGDTLNLRINLTHK
jgi:eukaryotic-like serine/threonine-protein kinase